MKKNLGPVLLLYFFKLLFNIMLSTERWFSKKSHPRGVSTQKFLAFLNSYSYALCFVQLFLWLVTLVMLRMQIMWLLVMQFSSSTFHILPLWFIVSPEMSDRIWGDPKSVMPFNASSKFPSTRFFLETILPLNFPCQ